jgi:hypothetical protein
MYYYNLKGWNRPHDVLTKRKMFRLEQETPVRPNSLEETTDASSLREDEIFAELPDNQQLDVDVKVMPKLKLPIPPPRLPPNFSRPRPDHAPMPVTSKPFLGLPRVTLGRTPAPTFASSEEFQPSMPKRRQLSHSGLIPDRPEFSSVHDPESAELLANSEDYKNKLSDPDFFQNITKAHVFHATNLNDDDNLRLDDPVIAAAAPVQFSPNVFQIQDLNPFGKKPDAVRTEPNYPPQQQQQQQQPPQPQPKTIHPEQPRLDEIAPAARSAHQSKDGHVDRPEVVYEPTDIYNPTDFYGKKPEVRRVDEYQHLLNSFYEGPVQVTDDVTAPTEPPMLEELTESVDETIATTESSTNVEPETTTTVYIDPIAEHVNKLLRHYLTTQEPLQEVPSLLFDAETGNVVLEYLSPDGERGRVEQPILELQKTEESTLQAFQAVPQDDQEQQVSADQQVSHDQQLQQMQEAFNEQEQQHQMQTEGQDHPIQEAFNVQGHDHSLQPEGQQGDEFGDYHHNSDEQQQVEFHPEDNYVQVRNKFETSFVNCEEKL